MLVTLTIEKMSLYIHILKIFKKTKKNEKLEKKNLVNLHK